MTSFEYDKSYLTSTTDFYTYVFFCFFSHYFDLFREFMFIMYVKDKFSNGSIYKEQENLDSTRGLELF